MKIERRKAGGTRRIVTIANQHQLTGLQSTANQAGEIRVLQMTVLDVKGDYLYTVILGPDDLAQIKKFTHDRIDIANGEEA